ncbi:MAG: hypothetical protein ACI4JM_09770 [Oscillospiraceae bacterium]
MTNKNEKTMQFANFNITFAFPNDTDNKPMLSYFKEIIYPTFKQNYCLKNNSNQAEYMFTDVNIKKIDDEFYIVGNFVKNTNYEIHTQYKEGSIISAESIVPTAPYSRFIVILKNHKMVLIKNEKESPDIRSFQKTYRSAINNYIYKYNKNAEDSDLLPTATVNIVDIPLLSDIKSVLKDTKKIRSVKLRFFPLNNDIDFTPAYTDVRTLMDYVKSKSGNLILNSPYSIDGVCELIEKNAGLVEPTLAITTFDGEKTSIKPDSFKSTIPININANVSSKDDSKIISSAKHNNVMSRTSSSNQKLYNECIGMINELYSSMENKSE